MPFGDGRAAIASLHGSTIAISRPPRMTNWSMAYSVASDRFCACGDQQHLDVGIDHLRVGGDRLHRLVCRSSMVDAYGWPPAALAAHRHHHRARIAIERQRRHHADHRPLRIRQVIDQLGQVVFQEAFALRLEEGDGALVVLQVGAGEAEIHLHAALIDRHALQADRPWRGPRCR